MLLLFTVSFWLDDSLPKILIKLLKLFLSFDLNFASISILFKEYADETLDLSSSSSNSSSSLFEFIISLGFLFNTDDLLVVLDVIFLLVESAFKVVSVRDSIELDVEVVSENEVRKDVVDDGYVIRLSI